MSKTVVVICFDGLGPQYLQACRTPNLRELARKGFFQIGQAMMPSVTNVNNASVVTAGYPEIHGVCSNYGLAGEDGRAAYVESGEDILAETMFRRAERLGRASVLVTAKDKLRSLLASGASVAVSAERPPDWLVQGVGEPPGIYSMEVNGWVIDAASHILSRPGREVAALYVATTDYAMHAYAPDEPESLRHMAILDDAVGRLVEAHPDATLLVTADHGMSRKTRMVDLPGSLSEYGIRVTAVPVIKDRYVLHHSNLGGCMFLYLLPGERGKLREAIKVLRGVPGVEEALSREKAAQRFRLHAKRIGDMVVTGEVDVVFGDPSVVEIPPRLRSHGSVHEQAIPIIGYNGDFDGFCFEENRDVGRYVFERVLV